MGRHEIGPDGVSFLHRESEKGIRSKMVRAHRKCMRFVMYNGKHIISIVSVHAVALFVIEKSHILAVIVTH